MKNLLQVTRRHFFDMQECLMITLQDKYDWRQYLMHSLPIAHYGIDASVAKQDICHNFLNMWSAKEFDARYCTDYILSNNRAQFFVTEMLIPDAAIGL